MVSLFNSIGAELPTRADDFKETFNHVGKRALDLLHQDPPPELIVMQHEATMRMMDGIIAQDRATTGWAVIELMAVTLVIGMVNVP